MKISRSMHICFKRGHIKQYVRHLKGILHKKCQRKFKDVSMLAHTGSFIRPSNYKHVGQGVKC